MKKTYIMPEDVRNLLIKFNTRTITKKERQFLIQFMSGVQKMYKLKPILASLDYDDKSYARLRQALSRYRRNVTGQPKNVT